MKLRELCRGIAYASLAMPIAAIPTMALAQAGGDDVDVVVTIGTLIRGTPVDAALPVEVYGADELERLGNPSALDFAKSLTVSGPTSGEAYYFGGAELTGNVQFNLRALGADKTLSLFNGRRVSQNTSVIPSNAIQRIEVLKDGAAVTYGADATGGVVNFITRNSFDGVELTGSYKNIQDSDGDYNLGLLAGFGGDTTSVLFAAQWEHRSELSTMDRDFSSLPYTTNPAPWSGLTNMASWLPRQALPASVDVTALGGTFNAEWGDPSFVVIQDFTRPSCEAVGGVYTLPVAPSTNITCQYNYISYYNLVEENDIYRLYGQVNSAVTDNMDFHLRVAFSRVHTPTAYGSPSQPVIRGPALAPGLTFQLYTPSHNPYVADFVARNPTFAGANGGVNLAITQGYTAVTYRAFAHGGNDLITGSNHSVSREIDNKYYHIATGFQGEFGRDLLGSDVSYDVGLTYNQAVLYNDNPDIVLYRLQQALNGFGGPNCSPPGGLNAVDGMPDRPGTWNRTPGSPAAIYTEAELADWGCYYYNPFASNFAGQPVLGLTNPNYDATLTNREDVVRWLFNKRAQENVMSNTTLDVVFCSLQLPAVLNVPALPGGDIAWAFGVQGRNTKNREVVQDPLQAGAQPCAWPTELGNGQYPSPTPAGQAGYTGCSSLAVPGPFQFFTPNPPDTTQQDQYSIFGQLDFPVLDTLQFSAAARYERFSGGLDTTVYKLSGKWDALTLNDFSLSFRGSYGTNYQAPGPGLSPGSTTVAVASYTRAGGQWLGWDTFTRTDIEPETATASSFGAILQGRGLLPDHDFRFMLDYFHIEIEDELGVIASVNDIANVVFPTALGGLADCSNPLAPRVTFNQGSCVQGVSSAGTFAVVQTDFGNGPTRWTAGFDLSAAYRLPVELGELNGTLTLNLAATNIRKFRTDAVFLEGRENGDPNGAIVQYGLKEPENRLGRLNFAVIGDAVPEWRANFDVNYNQGDHNLRLRTNYVSAVEDQRGPGIPGGVTALNPDTGLNWDATNYGVKGEDWISFDLHYIYDLNAYNTTLSASIVNVADRDPPPARMELGYDPRIANPLGRTIEVGVRYRF